MYVFDNAAPQAPARLRALAEVFDPGTIRQLDARGIAEGWRCLEVGGGLGTMTKWLSARVGPHGSVLTTDIDTRHLDTLGLANVEIRHHDVVEDPLPTERFDLAYTRLVLEHVSDPARAIANMVQAVKPGGWVVIEDFEVAPIGPDTEIPKTFLAMRQVIASAGCRSAFRSFLVTSTPILRPRGRHGRRACPPVVGEQCRHHAHAPERRAVARPYSRDRPRDGGSVRRGSQADRG